LVQSASHSWNFTLRYMELNRAGNPGTRHALAATPRELADIQPSYERLTRFGRFRPGLDARCAASKGQVCPGAAKPCVPESPPGW